MEPAIPHHRGCGGWIAVVPLHDVIASNRDLAHGAAVGRDVHALTIHDANRGRDRVCNTLASPDHGLLGVRETIPVWPPLTYDCRTIRLSQPVEMRDV